MAELHIVAFGDRSVETIRQLDPLLRYPCRDDSPVCGPSPAYHQIPLLHPVEQSCHVRIPVDQPFGDLAARKSFGLGSAENSKDVVLRA